MKQATPIKRALSTEQRNTELAMMRQQYSGGWPLWPFLPIKRSMSFGGSDYGVLLDSGPIGKGIKVEPIFYDYSPWASGPLDRNKIKAKYNSLEEMVDDGWIVD